MARVMVVEDDSVTCALLSDGLRQNGHLVLAADSAESALASIATLGLPDVAVVDVGLPGRDGLALLDVLRAQRGTQPVGVVVISAGPPPPAHRVTAADRFLAKPVSAESLLAAVDDVLPARRA